MPHTHASHDVTQVTRFVMPASSSASDAAAMALLPHVDAYEWVFDAQADGTVVLRVAHSPETAEAVQAEVLRSHPKIVVASTTDL